MKHSFNEEDLTKYSQIQWSGFSQAKQVKILRETFDLPKVIDKNVPCKRCLETMRAQFVITGKFEVRTENYCRKCIADFQLRSGGLC